MVKILNTKNAMGISMTNFSSKKIAAHYRSAKTQRFSHTKGQMFIVAAIFMIVGVILLRNLLSLPAITQEKTFQDVSYLDKNMKNIKNEFAYTTGVASVQPLPNYTGANYLTNFSDYIRTQFDSRLFYVFVFSNGTNQNVSITVGNYLQNNLSGILNVTNSTPGGRTFNLNDKNFITLEFNSSAAIINLTLNYTVQNTETVERLYFNSSTRNYVLGFFDITIKNTGFFVRSKSTYNTTW